jgi:hypothetical protein
LEEDTYQRNEGSVWIVVSAIDLPGNGRQQLREMERPIALETEKEFACRRRLFPSYSPQSLLGAARPHEGCSLLGLVLSIGG